VGLTEELSPIYLIFQFFTLVSALITWLSAITSRINSQTSDKKFSKFSIGSATVAASADCNASNHLPDCKEPGACHKDACLIHPNSSIHHSNLFR